MKQNKIISSIISIMGIGIIIKALGFVRSLLIASQFGSGETTDAFFLALSLVGILTSLFGGALGQTIVPILMEIKYKEGVEAKDRHMSNVVNLFAVVSVLVIGLLWFLAPHVIKLMAKDGFTERQLKLTVDLLRIGLPTLLLYNVTGLFRGYMHSDKVFVASELANLPYNLVYIIYLVIFGSIFGIKGLMVAHVFAVFSQLILPLYSAFKNGYQHSAIFEPKDDYLLKSFSLILPVFLGIAINDINVLIDKTMASRLISGSISALAYGDKLNSTVQQLFVAALSMVIFPLLSEAYQENERVKAIDTVQKGLNLVLVVVIPVSLAIIVLNYPVTKFFFERGEFTTKATQMTASAMLFYSLSLTPTSIKVLLLKLSYASMDMRLPFMNSLLSLIFNIIFNLIFIKYLGHSGLALATSVSSFLTLILLYLGLSRKGWEFNLSQNIKLVVKTMIASSIMAFVVWQLKNFIDPRIGDSTVQQFIKLTIYGGVGVTIYLGCIISLKTKEINEIIQMFKKR